MTTIPAETLEEAAIAAFAASGGDSPPWPFLEEEVRAAWRAAAQAAFDKLGLREEWSVWDEHRQERKVTNHESALAMTFTPGTGRRIESCLASDWRPVDEERITHGRHCICSACAAQDWAEPGLAPCGMHGPSCPPMYTPRGAAGDVVRGPGASVRIDTEPVTMLNDPLGHAPWDRDRVDSEPSDVLRAARDVVAHADDIWMRRGGFQGFVDSVERLREAVVEKE